MAHPLPQMSARCPPPLACGPAGAAALGACMLSRATYLALAGCRPSACALAHSRSLTGPGRAPGRPGGSALGGRRWRRGRAASRGGRGRVPGRARRRRRHARAPRRAEPPPVRPRCGPCSPRTAAAGAQCVTTRACARARTDAAAQTAPRANAPPDACASKCLRCACFLCMLSCKPSHANRHAAQEYADKLHADPQRYWLQGKPL
jgi:hypothetical protein